MKTLKSWSFVIYFFIVSYRNSDAATPSLLKPLGSLGLGNQNNPFSLSPLLNGGNNNNYRPNTGFNNNKFGGNGNSQFQFIAPSRDSEAEKNIANKIQNGGELSEDEKLAAQKFPGLQKLLDQLKELNRQKELQKQRENGNNGSDNEINAGQEGGPGRGDGKWLKLKKRKFFFQAQPVRPENEIVVAHEVVYYLN